jgi:hypothetical protein
MHRREHGVTGVVLNHVFCVARVTEDGILAVDEL